MMSSLSLAWSQTLNLWRAGALRVLVFALVLAVVAITAVGFFTKRVESALGQQGALLLGGDLVVLADHAIADNYIQMADKLDLKFVKTYEFPSMVIAGDLSQLAEIKAVQSGFPLRGDVTVGQSVADAGELLKSAPNAGEVWIEPRLANLLNVQVGDKLDVGDKQMRISAILLREPSRGGDMFSFAPRLMMLADDLPATHLIQYGSRVKYQLLLAGNPDRIAAYHAEIKPQLLRGERVQDLRNARPEIKLALDKAEQFLGLSAMVSVILAMVAMLLSSQPYIKQSLDAFALMRCFGATQKTVLLVLLWQTLLIAFLSAVFGTVIAYVVQQGLAKMVGHLFVGVLPDAGFSPAVAGLSASMAMMVAVVMPHAWQMRRLSAMNILRRETLAQPMSAQAKFLPAALTMMVMVFWQAQDSKIAVATMIAMLLMAGSLMLMTYMLLRVAKWILSWRANNKLAATLAIGLQGLKTRFGLSAMQMLGFSMGLTVLLLLALVRSDLIQNWQASLPADAPNRFAINIQPEQISGIEQFFKQQNIKGATVFPMVKGRLTNINQAPVRADQWQDERAKRLAEREFNLSWANQMQSDNQLQEGRWWRVEDHGKPYLSLEQELAKTLGIKLGDTLTFDVAGNPLTLTVTSLRKVDWDTMRANFFAVTPPGVLEQFPASYISSFHLPLGSEAALNQLVKEYSNLTVIDVAALMQQVRNIMQKMSTTVEYVFLFSMLTGLAVLYAALVSTRDERVAEATLMRVFGASRRQVSLAYFSEFFCIGLIAALLATLTANLLAFYVSTRILEIPFQFNFALALITMLSATAAIPFAAWLGLRSYLNIPPRQLLNSI